MAAALYRKPPPSAEELAGIKLTPEDFIACDDIDVWHENVESIEIFEAMSTQWTIGPGGGFTGLRYESLAVVWDIFGVTDRRQSLADVKIMELAAMAEVNRRD